MKAMRQLLAGLTVALISQQQGCMAHEQFDKPQGGEPPEFEPDFAYIPGIEEVYGIKFDRNHLFNIDSRFVMDQIINPFTGRYHTDGLMKNPVTGQMPNYLLYLTMDDCHYCDTMRPIAEAVARKFHEADSPFNYIVAELNCSLESSLYVCQYLFVKRLPKYVVLRPEGLDRQFQFPLAYRKNPQNLFRFAIDNWQDAYTQYKFARIDDMTEFDEWEHWFHGQLASMLEEANSFFLDWGYEWLGWYQLLSLALFMIFGPFLMCYQTTKMWGIAGFNKEDSQKDKAIEEDDEFEKDESAVTEETQEELKDEDQKSKESTAGKEKKGKAD